ncbi:MAG TPA: hypothetical protein VJZ91_07605 [Blastocatellia bacterium]|nr:hypothetical protein [Blastocatellia bacterium]
MSGQPKFFAKKQIAIALLLTLMALGFRLFIALKLPTDEPDDGRLYARIANNVLDRHVYSIATEEPFEPTYIRLPGYPLFLALVYKWFGRDNNRAVRVIQAVVDTLTCWLVAWLALCWTPAAWELEKRRRALLTALFLMAACPFLAIYAATLLTEVWTAFFATLCALAGSLALRSRSVKRQAAWWLVAGLAGGGATSFRPDGGLFVAAVGGTLALIELRRIVTRWRGAGKRNESDSAADGRRAARQLMAKALLQGAMLMAGFAVALAPWTIRNARVFGVFMPIAPPQANMPGEFVPRGFTLWLKTWVTDVKYTQTIEWAMDARPIHIEQVPPEAFDSPEERDRVAALLARYNNEPQPPPSAQPEIEDETAQPVPPPAPQSANKNTSNASSDSRDSQADDASGGDDDSGDSADDSADDSSDDEEPEEAAEPPPFTGEMTPDVDEGFMEVARERVRRHPFRFYVMMPLRRAASLWFDAHAQYYPFQGELFPLKDLDRDLRQHIWLPLFAALTWGYTILAALGAWVMWRGGDSRAWLLMLALLVLPRLAFLSTLENPEPRYVVEFFTFVAAASSLALAGPLWAAASKRFRRRSSERLAKEPIR